MATLTEQLKKQGVASNADIDWLNQLTADWQLVADLVSADLVLWVPTKDGTFVAAGHARPATSATIFYRDVTGTPGDKSLAKLVKQAFDSAESTDFTGVSQYEGIPTRIAAIPVRRRVSAKNLEVHPTPIAVVTRHANLGETKEPTRQQLSFRQSGEDLLEMMVNAQYPDLGNQTGSKRGAPRANDGFLRLDNHGKVTFASPNAVSAFAKFGFPRELESENLTEVVAFITKAKIRGDEDLAVVLGGIAPRRADAESKSATLSLRSIPIKLENERTGAIILCRDVSELRRQERELITKDATIREIHHRVKNNLQTVASLLRIQARRANSNETKESLEQAMRRVSAIALVHDTLSEGLNQEVSFDEVFDRVLLLVSEVAASHNTTVRTIIDGRFGQLKSEKATPLAVALTEIVTNAIEHGLNERSGNVLVHAERKQKKLIITVSDNGKGLPGGKIEPGLGTQIIRTLIEGELRGSISWFSPREGGARVVIEIPL